MANTFLNFPELFSKFNAFHRGESWFTAHSHHFWPDCTEEALKDYWLDSAKLVDEKWNHIFSQKIPKLKKCLAQHLEINSWEAFVFAPNTHELLFRLFTCHEFNQQKKIKVLTTKNEFHSFSRQIKLLEEHHFVEVDTLQFSDISNLQEQIESKLITNSYDFIFLSHVFFNLGLTVSKTLLDLIYEKTKLTSTKVILDAYHSFMALPFSMSKYEDHFFYLAGSYKYAAAGEGLCFLFVPSKFQLKPFYSGWFASFSELATANEKTHYELGASSMAGSTMDYSTLYKLLSVFDLYQQHGIKQRDIHDYVLKLQNKFLTALTNKTLLKNLGSTENPIPEITENEFYLHCHQGSLINPPNVTAEEDQAHFLCFRISDSDTCKILHEKLKQHKIFTDYRGNHLRFGFGIYQQL